MVGQHLIHQVRRLILVRESAHYQRQQEQIIPLTGGIRQKQVG